MAVCFLIPEEALRRRIELHRVRQCHTRNAFVSTASSTDLLLECSTDHPLEYLISPPAYGGTLWSGPRLQFDNTSHLRGTMFHDSTHNLSSNFGKFCRVALRQQAGPAGFEQEYVDAVYASRFLVPLDFPDHIKGGIFETVCLIPPTSSWTQPRRPDTTGQRSLRTRRFPVGAPELEPVSQLKVRTANQELETIARYSEQVLAVASQAIVLSLCSWRTSAAMPLMDQRAQARQFAVIVRLLSCMRSRKQRSLLCL